jgi:amidase
MKRVTRDQLCTSLSKDNPPALRVQPGEIFVMETNDRFATNEGPHSSPEAMRLLQTRTGPVYVEGAKSGDTLKVEVLEVIPVTEAYIAATPGRGPLGESIPQFRKTMVDITSMGVIFNDRVILPLRPMISNMAVAPAEGTLPSTGKGAFGGGMGNTHITGGATVYLPVFHEGAFLTIGDCHAAMGDGEAGASAVECGVDATLRVAIERHFQVTRPVVVTAAQVMTWGEGQTMEAATKTAIKAMADLLVDRLGIDHTDAAMLIASAADVHTCLAGNPPYAMKVLMPKSVLSL